MIKGQLASLQRDHAWDGFSQAERTAGQALGAYNPYQSNDPVQTYTKSESFEKRQEREDLDYARLDGGDVDRGRQARGAGAMRQAAEMADDKKKRDKEAVDRAELLMLQAQQAAAYYGEIADGLEETFEDKYGAQWREHMALQILDEDEMPLRRDGESMADYEARVEQALMDKLLDENGNIKPEYKDHPEYGQWAEWAHSRLKQRDLERTAELATDPSQPPEVRKAAREKLEGQQDAGDLRVGAQRLGVNGAKSEIIAEKTDDIREDVSERVSVAASADSFMNFNG